MTKGEGGEEREIRGDWPELVRTNLRLVLFMKGKGLEIPTTKELVEMFPLEHYR